MLPVWLAPLCPLFFSIELAQLAALTWHFDAWRWLQKHRVLMKIDRPWLHNHTPSPWACLAVGLTGKTHIFHRSSLWQPTVWTYVRAGPRTGSRTSASEQTGKLSSIKKDVQRRTPRERIVLRWQYDLLWALELLLLKLCSVVWFTKMFWKSAYCTKKNARLTWVQIVSMVKCIISKLVFSAFRVSCTPGEERLQHFHAVHFHVFPTLSSVTCYTHIKCQSWKWLTPPKCRLWRKGLTLFQPLFLSCCPSIYPWGSMSSTYAYMPMYSLTGYVAMLAVTMYGKDQVVEVVEKLSNHMQKTVASPNNHWNLQVNENHWWLKHLECNQVGFHHLK